MLSDSESSYEYDDASMANKTFGLHRKTADGNWYYDFYLNKKRFRGTTRTTNHSLARQYIRKKFVDIYKNVHGLVTEPAQTLVSDFIERHLNLIQCEASKEWYTSSKYTLREFQEFLTGQKIIYLTEINLEVLDKFKFEQLGKGIKKVTVKNKLKIVKALLNRALKYKLISHNPAKDLTPIRGVTKNKIHFFSTEEINRILEAFFDPEYKRFAYLKDFVYTALYTGMRRRELINLRFEDVDVENKQILVRNKDGFTTKSYKERIIPLHDALMPYFSIQRNGLCFTYSYKNKKNVKMHEDTATRNFKELLTALGIDHKAGLHTLRHTFASHLIMKGVPIRTVAEYLGHSSTYVTEIYSHLSPHHINSEIQKLGF